MTTRLKAAEAGTNGVGDVARNPPSEQRAFEPAIGAADHVWKKRYGGSRLNDDLGLDTADDEEEIY